LHFSEYLSSWLDGVGALSPTTPPPPQLPRSAAAQSKQAQTVAGLEPVEVPQPSLHQQEWSASADAINPFTELSLNNDRWSLRDFTDGTMISTLTVPLLRVTIAVPREDGNHRSRAKRKLAAAHHDYRPCIAGLATTIRIRPPRQEAPNQWCYNPATA